MADDAQGFWSYVHKDDQATHGAITRLADHVCQEYELLTGAELNLFRDLAKIEWGDRWKDQIRGALEATTFFIPIVTPRYFSSIECKKELLSFTHKAGELGLEALIMPIYFVDVPALNDGDSQDEAMRLIADSQREDWRNLRLLDETTQPYRVAVNKLATRLKDLARDREDTPVAPGVEVDGGDDEDPDGGAVPDEQGGALQGVSEASGVPDGEEGILEMLVRGEETFPQVVEVLQAINGEIVSFGDLATEATVDVKERDERGEGFKGKLAAANRLARNLQEPADRLEALGSQYAAHLITLDPAVRKMIDMAYEQASQNPEEAEEFFTSIKEMASHSGEAVVQIEDLIRTLDESANFSRELGAPLRRVRSALQSLVDGQAMIEAWVAHVERVAANGTQSTND